MSLGHSKTDGKPSEGQVGSGPDVASYLPEAVVLLKRINISPGISTLTVLETEVSTAPKTKRAKRHIVDDDTLVTLEPVQNGSEDATTAEDTVLHIDVDACAVNVLPAASLTQVTASTPITMPSNVITIVLTSAEPTATVAVTDALDRAFLVNKDTSITEMPALSVTLQVTSDRLQVTIVTSSCPEITTAMSSATPGVHFSHRIPPLAAAVRAAVPVASLMNTPTPTTTPLVATSSYATNQM